MTKEEFDSIPTLKEYLMLKGLSEEASEELSKLIVKEIVVDLVNIQPIDNKFKVEYLDYKK